MMDDSKMAGRHSNSHVSRRNFISSGALAATTVSAFFMPVPTFGQSSGDAGDGHQAGIEHILFGDEKLQYGLTIYSVESPPTNDIPNASNVPNEVENKQIIAMMLIYSKENTPTPETLKLLVDNKNIPIDYLDEAQRVLKKIRDHSQK